MEGTAEVEEGNHGCRRASGCRCQGEGGMFRATEATTRFPPIAERLRRSQTAATVSAACDAAYGFVLGDIGPQYTTRIDDPQ